MSGTGRSGRRRSPRPARRALTLVLGLSVAACGDRSPPPPPASPADILAARGAGDAFLQQDRLDEASVEFERLVEMAPDDPGGYAGLGLVALRDGRFEEADRRLGEARERAPGDPELALALARLREETGDAAEARSLLIESLGADSTNARTLWALASLEEGESGAGSAARIAWLGRLLDVEPGNLAATVELADARLAAGDGDGAVATLERLRQLAPDPPAEASAPFEAAIDAASTGDTAGARARLGAFREYFEVTGAYQADATALRPPPGRLVGIPRLAFSSMDNLRVVEEEAVLAAFRYSDASDLAGFAALAPSGEGGGASGVTLGDIDGDGDEDAVWADGGRVRFLRVDLGQFVDVTPDLAPADVPAGGAPLLADLDDDRRLDLFVGGDAPAFVRQRPDGVFELAGRASPAGSGRSRAAIAADLDQDGDLDVFEARSGSNRFFRNNGDWTFEERGVESGLAGPPEADTRAAAFGDLDDDLDLDLVLAEGDGGLRVLANARGGRFDDATSALGLEGGGPAVAVAIADLDNDGRRDIVAAGRDGVIVHRARPDGRFETSPGLAATLGALVPTDLIAVDFDNDGWLDLAVVGTPAGGGGPGARLFRNLRGERLEPADAYLPPSTRGFERVAAMDYNDDGDSDLVLVADDGSLALLRNDGGNANHFLRLDLVGLGEGSRKVNRFGIGARVEVRVGDLLQVRTVTRPSIRVGLDGRLKADVVRVVWPNGVAQDMYFPGTDQDLVEQQSLKGSCPLLYVWDGESFEFVGDVMWKSALGMPLGILGNGRRAYAPGYPSQEYRRLPDGVLVPRDGEYVMQLTEELWEAIYVDEVELVAVDHPAETDVFVNERFVPPAPTSLELWTVGARHRPVAAVDGRGRDWLPALAARDFDYVAGFRPGRFQGIAEPHELVLDLGDAARGGDAVLYLTGWIFPTDASINVALDQSGERGSGPALDVMGPDGEWRTAIADLGFPSGKDKTVVADLRGRFPTDDRRVRIRTDLMVFWDDAFFTVDAPPPTGGGDGSGPKVTRLEPTAADLHFRGFSRAYRRGGRYGPHWFDYDSVTMSPKWRDLRGSYTRYGDVRELLGAGDDMYVVSNAGDEITIRFDAAALPPLADGQARTFLLYTDGWVKDGDLNTATGDRVEPLPFRAQTGYPYGGTGTYPGDEAHRRYLETYQTREVRPGR